MAFLGISIPHSIGRLLSKVDVPGEKVSSSEFHITMLYFGEDWPITEFSKSVEVTYNTISNIKPFSIKMDKVTHFPSGESDKYPIITRVENTQLNDIREKLAKAFDKHDIDYSKIHKDFKAHITLSYTDKRPKDIEFTPIEYLVTELVLWGGDHGDDRIFVTFPLENSKKTSMLLQKAIVFDKIANNPLQNHLTSSYERRKIER